jgi:hypothetical protein
MWKTPKGAVSEKSLRVDYVYIENIKFKLSITGEIMPGKSIWKQDLATGKRGNPQAFPQKG